MTENGTNEPNRHMNPRRANSISGGKGGAFPLWGGLSFIYSFVRLSFRDVIFTSKIILVILAVLTALCGNAAAAAIDVDENTNSKSRYANTRKILYQVSMNKYWMFYITVDNDLGWKSYDGAAQTFISSGTLVTGADVGGDVSNASIWHNESGQTVYIAVPAGSSDDNTDGAPYDSVYVYMRNLLSNGNISGTYSASREEFDPISSGLCAANLKKTFDHRAGMGIGVARLQADEVTVMAGGFYNNGLSDLNFGFVGTINLGDTLSEASATGIMACDATDDTDTPTQLNTGVVPINDAGTWKSLVSWRDGNSNILRILDLTSAASGDVGDIGEQNLSIIGGGRRSGILPCCEL
ncbi:hypothetical protein ACFL6Y_08130 [Elusimicrobiota bacterium]